MIEQATAKSWVHELGAATRAAERPRSKAVQAGLGGRDRSTEADVLAVWTTTVSLPGGRFHGFSRRRSEPPLLKERG